MEITEVRIKLMDEPGERLQAFCSITFDNAFVVRDLKIIDGTTGPFVAMPSRKLTSHCPKCRYKNHMRAGYCNQCGARLREDRADKYENGRSKLYADIAHPINPQCREMIQERVIAAFEAELDRAEQPGYVSSYDELESNEAEFAEPVGIESAPPPRPHLASPAVAAHTPRGPHKAPSRQPAGKPVAGAGAGSESGSGFSEGIF